LLLGSGGKSYDESTLHARTFTSNIFIRETSNNKHSQALDLLREKFRKFRFHCIITALATARAEFHKLMVAAKTELGSLH
jgi:hypothetical protein